MTDQKYRSRKFGLAVFAMLASTVGLFMGHLDGNAWYLSIGVILGLYSAANVMEKKQ